MNLPETTDLAVRRKLLVEEIARQRAQLSQAYDNLERPIHYAEYGMKAYSVYRNYQWVFTALPPMVGVVFSLTSNLFGGRKNKKVAAVAKTPAAAAPQVVPGPYLPGQQQDIRNQPPGLKKTVLLMAGRAWELFQLYRRVKPYLQ